MTRAITLVCFDWGGVLIETAASWQDAVQRAGLPLRCAHVGMQAWTAGGHGDRFQRGDIDYAQYCAAVATAFEGAYDADEVRAIHDAVLVGEYVGAAELVAELNRTPGIETALLSNTNAAHYDLRGNYPSAAALRYPLASHLLRLAKPDAAIFAAAERETGHPGASILFFDDRDENIEAAQRAGWRAEKVFPAEDPVAQMRRHLRTHGVLT